MKRVLLKSKHGFALMTVLLMTVVLLVLLLSLVSLSSQTLYRATADIENAAAVPIAEAALNEVMIKLNNNPSWGTNKEKLYMKVGTQDPGLAGLDPSKLPTDALSKSALSFEGKSCFYVSFDKDDLAFKGKKYFSVNNLENSSSTYSWRDPSDPNKLPAWSSSVVITVGVGNTVRHFEVILRNVPPGAMLSGSRGFTDVKTDKFSMDAAGGSRANIHGNEDNATDISMHFAPLKDTGITIDFKKSAEVTSREGITFDGTNPMPADFKPNQGARDIPNLNINDYFDPTGKPELPAGKYEYDGTNLMYTPPTGGPAVSVTGTSIGGAIEFKAKEILIKDNVVVPYVAGDASKTGNLEVVGAKIKFDKKNKSIYLAGDTNERYPTGAYKYGNIEVICPSDKIVEGEGNIYARGGIQLAGKEIDAGYLSENIALYADGDILLSTTNDTKFKGLIYTKGDFHCVINENVNPSTSTDPNNPVDPNSLPADKFKKFIVDGALIAAGKDPNEPLADKDKGFLKLSAAEVDITIDDSVLGGLTTGTGGTGLRVVSWHEF